MAVKSYSINVLIAMLEDKKESGVSAITVEEIIEMLHAQMPKNKNAKSESMVFMFHNSDDGNGFNDHISIRNISFKTEPLIGDYRGVELCRVNYIPSRSDSVERAEEIAEAIVSALHPEVAN